MSRFEIQHNAGNVANPFEAREEHGDLVFTSATRYSMREAIVAAGVRSVLAGALLYGISNSIVVTGFTGAILALILYFHGLRVWTAQLRVTQLSFLTTQRRWFFGPHRTVPSRSVVGLTYRPVRSTVDWSDPEGLYAQTELGEEFVLLPNLNERETATALAEINRCFPGIPTLKKYI